MNRRRTIWFFLLLAIAALSLVLIVRHSRQPEPTYAGRTFTSWFNEDELGPNYFNNAPSTKAICAMGSNAVPLLVSRINYTDAPWTEFYFRHYRTLPAWLKRHLPTPRISGMRQLIAARLLFELGDSARSAAPDLIAAYGSASRKYLRLPFGHIDWYRQLTNPAPPRLSAAPPDLPGGNFEFWALQTLAHTGSDDPQVIPLLLSAFHEPNSNLHGLVSDYMRDNTNLNVAISRSETILLIALNDENPVIRAPAAEMLGFFATNHPEVIPPLLKAAATDFDRTVREAAMDSLSKFPVTAAEVLPIAVPLLNGSDLALRHPALALLMHAGHGAALFTSLTEFLASPDPTVRVNAAQALAFFGPRAKSSVPKLTELTEVAHEPDDAVRQAATNALRKIVPDSNPPSSARGLNN